MTTADNIDDNCSFVLRYRSYIQYVLEAVTMILTMMNYEEDDYDSAHSCEQLKQQYRHPIYQNYRNLWRFHAYLTPVNKINSVRPRFIERILWYIRYIELSCSS